MVPYALGQNVEFIKDYGPQLGEFNLKKFLSNDKNSFTQKLNQFIKRLKRQEKN